jgi:ParB-like chromosome segregation protein Spo0J
MAKANQGMFEPHHLANLFPSMDSDALDALTQDIKANGLRSPVVMYEGHVLDGRARVLACRKAGVAIESVKLPAGMGPRAFLFSVNMQRRHLSPVQRATLAAQDKLDSKGKLTIEETASKFGLRLQNVRYALRAVESGDKELAAALMDPETTVTALKGMLESKGLKEVLSKTESSDSLVLGADGVMRTAAEDAEIEALLGTGNTTQAPAPAAAAPRASEAPVAGKGNAASKASRHAPSAAAITHVASMGSMVDTLARSTAQDLESFFEQAVQRGVWARLKKVEAAMAAKKAIGKASKTSSKATKTTA